jgi:hypothetical protein
MSFRTNLFKSFLSLRIPLTSDSITLKHRRKDFVLDDVSIANTTYPSLRSSVAVLWDFYYDHWTKCMGNGNGKSSVAIDPLWLVKELLKYYVKCDEMKVGEDKTNLSVFSR